MMLLADSLCALAAHRGVRQRDADYCERQKSLEEALTKIRCLAEFMAATGDKGLLRVTDREFGGKADGSFRKKYYDTISKYVHHLSVQRFNKDIRYPRPNADTAMTVGKLLLKSLKAVMDPHKHTLKRDAAHWYTIFQERYHRLFP